MRSILLIIGCLALDILTAATGWPHGVEGHVEKAEGWCLTAQYDDGEPMSYAAVEIRAPGLEIPFQGGRTDRNGRFMFRPDGRGLWQAVVTDGLGHRKTYDMAIGDEKAGQGTGEARSPADCGEANRPLKVIVGLSVIMALFGFLYGWKARRARTP